MKMKAWLVENTRDYDYFIDTPDEVVNELENELNSVLTFWMVRHDLDPQIFRYIPVSELDII